MIQLWAGIALLTLLALAFIFLPFAKTRKQHEAAIDRTEENIHIFKERLAELEAERDAGTLQPAAFDELKLELEKNLLEDAEGQPSSVNAESTTVVGKPQLMAVMLIAILIPIMGLGLYHQYGNADLVELTLNRQDQPFAKEGRQPTVEEVVGLLEAELAKKPDNAEGWYVLATTYMNIGEFTKATEAFQKVLLILPSESPQYPLVMGQYAQALYFVNGDVTDEVRQQIELTLEREPNEVTALGLSGIDQYSQGNFNQAISVWRKALEFAEPEAAESIKNGIRSALTSLEEAGEPLPDVPELVDVALPLTVSISSELLAQLSPDQPVFIFARAVGGKIPVAAARFTVKDLPITISLDDSMAMTPQMRLSSQSEVEVGARISMSGQPQASPGDLASPLLTVTVAELEEPLNLLIDHVVQ